MTREALVEHIIAHTDTMYYVSRSLLYTHADREDAVQQAIEKALIKHASLRDESQARAWLTRILINECYNIMRKRKREIPGDIPPDTAPPTADGAVYAAVMSLEARYRLPIVLHYQQGYTTREVAHILRTPEGTIKGRLVRGRKLLGELLHKEGVSV